MGTVAALVVIFTRCAPLTIVVTFLWEPFALGSMRGGISAAPQENWSRNPGKIGSIVLYAALCAMILSPCGFVLWRHGVLPAIAAAWIIVTTMRATIPLMNKLLGEIDERSHDTPRTDLR